MHKIWAVIRREFVERARTRAFVIGTILGPLMMGALFVLPIMLQRNPHERGSLDGAGRLWRAGRNHAANAGEKAESPGATPWSAWCWA
jgi:hypothetical protein